jgi:hypothetical protein
MNTEAEDRVRARAYALWEREGQPEGGAERHWTQAEEERAEALGQGEAPATEVAGTAGRAQRGAKARKS